MRILILCDVRWFNANAWHAVGLAEALDRAGHDVWFAARADSPPGRHAAARGVRVVDLPLERAGPLTLLRGVHRLAALARAERIEVFDAHRSEGFLAAALAARRVGRPLAVVRTRSDVRAPKGHWLNRLLHRRGAHAIGAAASFMCAEFAALGVGRDRIRVVHPGVMLEHFSPGAARDEAAALRAELTAAGGAATPAAAGAAGAAGAAAPLIGVVGRLTAVKGHVHFVDAAARLARAWPDARFVIAGEAWDVSRAELKQRAVSHGIEDRLRFLGRLPDVRPLLEALDVVVVPSTGSEAVSRVALEAMALARPVVASAVGGLPELLDEGAGVLVPPGDAAALAAALDGLLRDPAAAAELGRRGRRRLEARFTRDRAARATVDLYTDALRRAARGRSGKEGTG
ncbi:MAG TPA: glycosyltransferase family 4 protein [Longimicrobiales bacterium]